MGIKHNLSQLHLTSHQLIMSCLLKCFPHLAPRSALVLGFPHFPALWIQMGPSALLGSLLLSGVTCCLLLLPDLLDLPVISGLQTPQLFISLELLP